MPVSPANVYSEATSLKNDSATLAKTVVINVGSKRVYKLKLVVADNTFPSAYIQLSLDSSL